MQNLLAITMILSLIIGPYYIGLWGKQFLYKKTNDYIFSPTQGIPAYGMGLILILILFVLVMIYFLCYNIAGQLL
jgi:hypothetical protein